jgi:hypothetical protein
VGSGMGFAVFCWAFDEVATRSRRRTLRQWWLTAAGPTLAPLEMSDAILSGGVCSIRHQRANFRESVASCWRSVHLQATLGRPFRRLCATRIAKLGLERRERCTAVGGRTVQLHRGRIGSGPRSLVLSTKLLTSLGGVEARCRTGGQPGRTRDVMVM